MTPATIGVQRKTDRLVILAGGVSSRMRESLERSAQPLGRSFTGNKGMLGMDEDVPFLDYLLSNARCAGLRDIVIVTGERADDIRARYGSKERGNPYHGMSISYAVQRVPNGRTKPLGTADALFEALRMREDWSGTSILVCNSDNLYSTPAIRALAELPHAGGWIDYDMDGLRFPPERIARFGVTVTDSRGFLVRIFEKPAAGEIVAIHAAGGRVGVTMNIWRFDRDMILPYLEHCPVNAERDEKELPAAVAAMLRDHPRSMKAVRWNEHVPDLTGAGDIESVREYLRSEFPHGPWPETAEG